MKNIIPFTKELDFQSKVSEITSISLEREFAVEEGTVEGNLFVTGEYKSHEISVNEIPFSFKIPFTIEIPSNIVKDSVTIEISDFAYDVIDSSKIKVNIELELEGEEGNEVIEEPEEKELPKVDTEEILAMMEPAEDREVALQPPEIPVETKEEKTEEEYTTYHMHIVLENETIASICEQYQISQNVLSEYNDLTNFTSGMKILIPKPEDE